MPQDDQSDAERLAVIETKVDTILENQKKYDSLRDEFIALKARIGLVSAVIGTVFAALTTVVLKMLTGSTPPSP
jgi:hypothetical protein